MKVKITREKEKLAACVSHRSFVYVRMNDEQVMILHLCLHFLLSTCS